MKKKTGMKELLRRRISELTSLIGVSGYEWDVARYIAAELKGSADSIEQLPNGQLIAVKKGAHPGPKVLVTAHMDEVGYEVKSISAKGFLYFDKIGGATEACLPARRVLVKGDMWIFSFLPVKRLRRWESMPDPRLFLIRRARQSARTAII